MKSIFIILFSTFLSLPIFGQDLYLRMNDALEREYSASWRVSTKSNPTFKVYGYHSYICGPLLSFVCKDKATMSQTLPATDIGNYPIKTLEEFEVMMAGKTKDQVLDYLEGLQHIYIVEVLSNNTIEVSKVKIGMTFMK